MKRGKIESEYVKLVQSCIPKVVSDTKVVDEISIHLQEKNNINKGKLMYYHACG